MIKKSKQTKILRNILLGFAFILSTTEAGIRIGGLTDFPIYTVDKELGYIPRPQQSGSFLNKNSWVFNDRSMGIEANWNPQRRPNILVIGNSIIMGGNPYSQKDKVGPLIQEGVGDQFSVWPIAAGGWTNINEIIYLEKNPDVMKSATFFVWTYMHGGLSQLSPWRGEYVFPSEKPIFASWYALRRYILPHFINFDMNELPPTGTLDDFYLKRFDTIIYKLGEASGKMTPGILFIYPKKHEFIASQKGEEWLPERKSIEEVATRHRLKIVDISRSPEWNEDLYREATHPTPEGNAVIAKILTAEIKKIFVNSSKTDSVNDHRLTAPALK